MVNIVEVLVVIINKFGYLGIFISTCLEYACFPVSSEILLPFIGYCVYEGELKLINSILISTLGASVGCSFCYGVGRFGNGFIRKVICNKSKSLKAGIENSEKYFKLYGKQSVMIGRMIPIVRTYISIPAGMAMMNFTEFLIFTILGSLLWNTILISIGFLLGEHWNKVSIFFANNKVLSYVIVLALAFLVIYRIKKSNKQNAIKK